MLSWTCSRVTKKGLRTADGRKRGHILKVRVLLGCPRGDPQTPRRHDGQGQGREDSPHLPGLGEQTEQMPRFTGADPAHGLGWAVVW